MRLMLAAAVSLAALASASNAAPPQLTPAQRNATHAMFEHVVNMPTVIGRHRVPEMAKYLADQFKAFPPRTCTSFRTTREARRPARMTRLH
jgi:hypothetical protein